MLGRSFFKTYIRGENTPIYESQIKKAAEEIGYTVSAEGKGVPVRILFYGDNTEWLEVVSPVLEAGSDASDGFARALSRHFKAPVLGVYCCDSDYAVCQIIDSAADRDTIACINEPDEDMSFDRPDLSAWTAACKKKWKCKEAQFAELFSGNYAFAEDGLEKLAKLIQLPAESYYTEDAESEDLFVREFWIMPEADFATSPFPRTLPERLTAYIDETFAQKLSNLGYRRFGGSSLRWFKVFGEEGKEIVSGIVLVEHHHQIEVLYNVQALCCPLVLSDRYYPMHDQMAYWFEARAQFSRFLGYENDPCSRLIDGVVHWYPLDEPESIFAYLDDLVPGQLEKVTDVASLRGFITTERLYTEHIFAHNAFFLYRMLVEAILAGIEPEAYSLSHMTSEAFQEHAERFRCPQPFHPQMILELPQLYLDKGFPACLEALKKVRDKNLQRLKKGGII